MATEKIPIQSLLSKLTSIPGGIRVYDSTGAEKKLVKPSLLSELQAQGIQTASKEDFEDQGIRLVSTNEGVRVQFIYPKDLLSLVSFQGILSAHTLIFTNPSEDPGKHRQELTTEVFQTEIDIYLTDKETATIPVRRLSDGASLEISRLGHLISLTSQDQEKTSPFPPSDLRLFLPPVHIPSQHLGDCAADTVQTALFFADGLQQEFAGLANRIYKKYIGTNQLVLFSVDNPILLQEVKEAYSLPDSLSQQDEDAIAVFANMIRRYILVRLLDFGTKKQIAALNVPPTVCLIPSAVPQPGVVYRRRKSINALAGATIARKISRVFSPESMLSKELQLKPTTIHLEMEHKFFCLLFKLFKQTSFHSFVWRRSVPVSFDLYFIRAILFPLIQTQQNTAGADSLEGGGHSISLFRFQGIWYLQDDNIGIAKPLPKFNLEKFLTLKGQFFISSYGSLLNKSNLIEQGFFTEKELRQGKGGIYIYYGYRYTKEGIPKETILYKDVIDYKGRFDAGGESVYLCVGDIDEEQKQKALFRCDSIATEAAPPKATKSVPKVKDLPPALLEQMNVPLPLAQGSKRETGPFRELRRNILANLNSFHETRRGNKSKATQNNATRKVKAYTNAKILNQFTAF